MPTVMGKVQVGSVGGGIYLNGQGLCGWEACLSLTSAERADLKDSHAV